MKPAFSSYVLVDANIAKSASDPAVHPVAQTCREVARILGGKGCPIGMGMTPALAAEWRKHATRIMTRWLVMMETRGRVMHKPDKPVASLRRDVRKVADAGIKAALLKDIHITEAAIVNAWQVLSLDKRQRRHLNQLHQAGNLEVGRIHWVNPLQDEEWKDWIFSGCSVVYNLQCQNP